MQNALKGDYGTFTISKEDETTVRWTEKITKQSWTLKFIPTSSIEGQMDLPGVGLLWMFTELDVQPDCPYYANGYTTCEITLRWDIEGIPEDADFEDTWAIMEKLPGVEKPFKVLNLKGPPNLDVLRIGVMEALSVVYMMDKELQNNIDDFVLDLSGLIRSRYALSIEMWNLAEAMHKKQQKLDEEEKAADAVAIGAGVLAFVGMVLAPVTGGASEVIALAVDAMAFVQVGSEIAATVINIENEDVAKDLVAEAQTKVEENNKSFGKMEKAWGAFEALVKTKYAAMVTDIAEKTGAPYIGPTLEQFQTLVVFGRTLRQSDPEFGNIPTKEIAALDIEEVDAEISAGLDGVKNVWRHYKLGLGLAHLRRVAVVANAVNLITGKSKNVVKKIFGKLSWKAKTNVHNVNEIAPPNQPGSRREAWGADANEIEMENLIPRAEESVAEGSRTVEAVEQGRRWRYAWDMEAEHPGLLLKFVKWTWKACKGVELSGDALKFLAKAKFSFGVVLTAVGTGLDVWAFTKVKKRIDEGSWSEAAVGLKKQHVPVEAQVNEFLKFRASLDASFVDDFFLLRIGDKYLSGPAAAAGQLEFKDLGEVNMGIMDPNLQFQGLSKTNGRFDIWRHHLTGGYIDIEQASLSKGFTEELFKTSIMPLLLPPLNFSPDNLPAPVKKLWQDSAKPFHAAKLSTGTTISPSHTSYKIKISGENKDIISIIPKNRGALEWTYGELRSDEKVSTSVLCRMNHAH